MESTSTKDFVKIDSVVVILGGLVVPCKPEESFWINPTAEPLPETWHIIYNDRGNKLVINE